MKNRQNGIRSSDSGENIMFVRKMEVDDLEEIIILDMKCFKRPEKKKIERVSELFYLSKGYSYVGLENGKIIAYVFTHLFGTTASIGPIGVLEEERNCGYGKELLSKTIDYIKDIGVERVYLEVLPDKIYNLAFYSKAGFKMDSQVIQMSLSVNDDYNIQADYLLGDQIDNNELKVFLNQIEHDNSGFSYALDILRALDQNPSKTVFIRKNGQIFGFLCTYFAAYDYVFGYLDKNVSDQEFLGLYKMVCCQNNKETIPIRMCTTDSRIGYLLSQKGLLEKLLIRMVFYCKPDNETKYNQIIRSFIG